jgi:pSer/pThr/pTyr-binding forkhead associated (FHA) protein
MFNLGGQEGGIPIVGWIVPIDGPNRFQTFKLMQGVTKIGSGPEANIVIDDGFMSSQHAEFVMSPSGFMLKDGGSTNGTYVNERRVKDHELVDNDVFRMGKTNFKFKSIN